jgi:hypothetical protein
MRIALCLHGVVGHLYTDKEQRRWSEDVDYRIGLEHYRRHLFAVNGCVDVFIHSWSTQYAENIIQDYRPQRHLFQTQIDFEKETTALNFLKSRWYSTKAVVELKKAYEGEHGFKYDWVMLSRFDLALLRDLDFAQCDKQLFYAARHALGDGDAFCDLFFFAKSSDIDLFASLYDAWEQYKIYHAHREAYYHARKMGLTIGYHLWDGDDFALVRNIYENCRYAGAEFPGLESCLHLRDGGGAQP